MVNSKLIEYVRAQLANRYTPLQIETHLQQHGYTMAQVKEALTEVMAKGQSNSSGRQMQPTQKTRVSPRGPIAPLKPRQPPPRPNTRGASPQPHQKLAVPVAQNGQSAPGVSPQKTGQTLTIRKPIYVLLLFVVTLGLYGIYWFAVTSVELKNITSEAPNPQLLWLLLVPVVGIFIMIFYAGQHSRAIYKVTNFNPHFMFIFWASIILSPVAIFVSQREINLTQLGDNI